MDLEQWISFLSWACIVITLLGYSAGIPAMIDIVAKKSTHNIPFLPFLLGWITNIGCLWYGTLIWDWPTLVCNSVGTALHIVYVSVYIIYANKKVFPLQLIGFGLASLLALYYYLQVIVITESDIIYQLGLSVMTFIFIWNISPFIEIREVMHTKSSECLSVPLSLAMFSSCLVWTLYGHAKDDIFITAPCVPGVLSGLIQLYLLWRYPASKMVKTE